MIGVIGLGLMGQAVSNRLAEAGYPVVGFDVDAAKRSAFVAPGRIVSNAIAEVAKACRVIVLCVFDTDQVETVVEGEGGIAGARPDATVLCTSTCDPERIARLAARCAARGIAFLEVPISGSSRQVADGQGVGLIGGELRTMHASAPVLDAICPVRHYLGAAGNGARAKLATNLVLGLNRAALAEGLIFAERMGLEPQSFLGVLKQSAAYSQAMDVKGDKMATRHFEPPQSRVDQSLKDFELMLAQGAALGQALPFATLYAELMRACVAQGEANWDNAAIIEEIRRRKC